MSKEINYALGLDIGIASVGWAVINLDKKRIEDLGVRTFNIAEIPKTGKSLAAPRREARGRRRLLRRKAYRVNRVRKLILSNNILSKEELNNLFSDKNITSVWEARIKALDEKISKEEFCKILINLCKRRGFKSNRKNEAKDEKTGKVLNEIKNNMLQMKELNCRTIGEYIYKKGTSSIDKTSTFRNKLGNYNMCVSRSMIRDEINMLFEKQKELGNIFANDDIKTAYLEIFDSQRPYSNFYDLEKMVGYCTFEKSEKRAPKCSISAEKFMLYDNMNKLYIIKNGDKRKLTDNERNVIIEKAFNGNDITYSNLRKCFKLTDDERFSLLNYSSKDKISKTEKTRFIFLKGYSEIKNAIENNISKEYWLGIKDNRGLLNNLSYILSLCKTDDDILKQMKLHNIDDKIAEAVIEISFSKFNNLSIKALERIIPFMKEGYQYNEACEKAGYDFKNLYTGERTKKLPVIDIEEIVNPVVNRALAQTRKVVNAIIEKYGSPVRVNIELARELSKSKELRAKIKKNQDESRNNSTKARNDLEKIFNKKPTASELLKYRLWKEQNGMCAYSQKGISLTNLFDPGLCEIDHILPFSRSFDDSLSNKIFVLASENQTKGNRTPYEYFGSDDERWNTFLAWVKGSNLSDGKKLNLLNKNFPKEIAGFTSNSLKNTQYISKYIATFIGNRLLFKESSSKQKVVVINGRATAYLRAKWGLIKNRDNGDKHHALDAAVVGVVTQGMIQEIARFSKAHELKYFRSRDNFIDVETGEVVKLDDYKYLKKDLLPRPWRGFSEELKMRLSEDPVKELEKEPMPTYDDEFIKTTVRPIFVSRVPVRKISGKLFGETVYSKNNFKDGFYVKKKRLIDLNMKDLDNIYKYETDKKLYDAIKQRLEEFNGNAKKAFEEDFRKPSKDGNIGAIVKSIKLKTSLPVKEGIEFNKGVVDREGMVRIDIYEKNNEFFVVPVYRYQLQKGIIPKRAATSGKRQDQWMLMDETYRFKFSVFKNDLLEIKFKNKKNVFGYYSLFDRSVVTLTIFNHDKSQKIRTGIKTNVLEINKYEVDALGRYYKCKGGGTNKL